MLIIPGTPRERLHIYLSIYMIQQNKKEYITDNVRGRQRLRYSSSGPLRKKKKCQSLLYSVYILPIIFACYIKRLRFLEERHIKRKKKFFCWVTGWIFYLGYKRMNVSEIFLIFFLSKCEPVGVRSEKYIILSF